MPRSGQIIPKFLHPSEETYINDNTVFTDSASGNSGPRFLHVFTSPKGIDNKLIEKRSVGAWVDEFGFPDYRNYGQPGYMPYSTLSTQYARSWSMRVMPENAAYSNMILTASVKVDTTVPATPKLKVKFNLVNKTNLTDKSLA